MSGGGRAGAYLAGHSGEVLLFYNDGVTEARRPADGELFGEERLHTLLADCAGLDAAAVVERISETVLAYCAHDSVDDIALLALRVPPAGGAEER
ncbi:serine/threonine-protein phosphatase [Streptosporangium subroseum]|nr:serine/threonine-protein phosphatase [Streptosporangium subroseum]